WSCWAD
ncbi:DEAD/DEAH box helicase family protein, partial [Vibrio parahaemolyticus EKP-028]